VYQWGIPGILRKDVSESEFVMQNKLRKGIILAGGNGTRLHPMTRIICKQLLPVYDKPLIYYPLSTLMLLGIRDILIISTPDDTPVFEKLFGSGSQLGLTISYAVQERPEGIAQALIIGKEFINQRPAALILGDNIFYGNYSMIRDARNFDTGATIFTYKVNNPQRYGVVEFDNSGKPSTIVEKPQNPKSNYVVTGLYFYDATCIERATQLKPSARGELEITDLNRTYLNENSLNVIKLGRGMAWLDTGTPEAMLEAGDFIATIEKRQGQKIACIEEIAYRMNYIDRDQMQHLINSMADNSYRKYLNEVLKETDAK